MNLTKCLRLRVLLMVGLLTFCWVGLFVDKVVASGSDISDSGDNHWDLEDGELNDALTQLSQPMNPPVASGAAASVYGPLPLTQSASGSSTQSRSASSIYSDDLLIGMLFSERSDFIAFLNHEGPNAALHFVRSIETLLQDALQEMASVISGEELSVILLACQPGSREFFLSTRFLRNFNGWNTLDLTGLSEEVLNAFPIEHLNPLIFQAIQPASLIKLFNCQLSSNQLSYKTFEETIIGCLTKEFWTHPQVVGNEEFWLYFVPTTLPLLRTIVNEFHAEEDDDMQEAFDEASANTFSSSHTEIIAPPPKSRIYDLSGKYHQPFGFILEFLVSSNDLLLSLDKAPSGQLLQSIRIHNIRLQILLYLAVVDDGHYHEAMLKRLIHERNTLLQILTNLQSVYQKSDDIAIQSFLALILETPKMVISPLFIRLMEAESKSRHDLEIKESVFQFFGCETLKKARSTLKMVDIADVLRMIGIDSEYEHTVGGRKALYRALVYMALDSEGEHNVSSDFLKAFLPHFHASDLSRKEREADLFGRLATRSPFTFALLINQILVDRNFGNRLRHQFTQTLQTNPEFRRDLLIGLGDSVEPARKLNLMMWEARGGARCYYASERDLMGKLPKQDEVSACGFDFLLAKDAVEEKAEKTEKEEEEESSSSSSSSSEDEDEDEDREKKPKRKRRNKKKGRGRKQGGAEDRTAPSRVRFTRMPLSSMPSIPSAPVPSPAASSSKQPTCRSLLSSFNLVADSAMAMCSLPEYQVIEMTPDDQYRCFSISVPDIDKSLLEKHDETSERQFRESRMEKVVKKLKLSENSRLASLSFFQLKEKKAPEIPKAKLKRKTSSPTSASSVESESLEESARRKFRSPNSRDSRFSVVDEQVTLGPMEPPLGSPMPPLILPESAYVEMGSHTPPLTQPSSPAGGSIAAPPTAAVFVESEVFPNPSTPVHVPPVAFALPRRNPILRRRNAYIASDQRQPEQRRGDQEQQQRDEDDDEPNSGSDSAARVNPRADHIVVFHRQNESGQVSSSIVLSSGSSSSDSLMSIVRRYAQLPADQTASGRSQIPADAVPVSLSSEFSSQPVGPASSSRGASVWPVAQLRPSQTYALPEFPRDSSDEDEEDEIIDDDQTDILSDPRYGSGPTDLDSNSEDEYFLHRAITVNVQINRRAFFPFGSYSYPSLSSASARHDDPLQIMKREYFYFLTALKLIGHIATGPNYEIHVSLHDSSVYGPGLVTDCLATLSKMMSVPRFGILMHSEELMGFVPTPLLSPAFMAHLGTLHAVQLKTNIAAEWSFSPLYLQFLFFAWPHSRLEPLLETLVDSAYGSILRNLEGMYVYYESELKEWMEREDRTETDRPLFPLPLEFHDHIPAPLDYPRNIAEAPFTFDLHFLHLYSLKFQPQIQELLRTHTFYLPAYMKSLREALKKSLLAGRIEYQRHFRLLFYESVGPLIQKRFFGPLVSFRPHVDVEDLITNLYLNPNCTSTTMKMRDGSTITGADAIKRILRSFNQEQLRKFLWFVTGSDVPPLNGFKHNNIGINCSYSEKSTSFARTCFKILCLSVSASYEDTETWLIMSILGSSGFSRAEM